MTWRRGLLLLGLCTWLIGVFVAFYFVWIYKMTPGELADAPRLWPADSKLARDPARPTLVMIAHPKCPCTTASMTELGRLADELDGKASIHVLLVRPEGAAPSFVDTTIADRARTIRGAKVHVDEGGVEADRFGARVSGSTLLFARDGALAFRGGLTVARGHEGRGPASDRIVALVSQSATDPAEAPTFGCALFDRNHPRTTARLQ